MRKQTNPFQVGDLPFYCFRTTSLIVLAIFWQTNPRDGECNLEAKCPGVETVRKVLREVKIEETKPVKDPKVKDGLDRAKHENGKMIFNKPAISNHTKPLFLSVHINGTLLDKVLEDNGSVVNSIPLNTLLLLVNTKEDIISIDLIVITVTGKTTKMLRVIPLQITV